MLLMLLFYFYFLLLLIFVSRLILNHNKKNIKKVIYLKTKQNKTKQTKIN